MTYLAAYTKFDDSSDDIQSNVPNCPQQDTPKQLRQKILLKDKKETLNSYLTDMGSKGDFPFVLHGDRFSEHFSIASRKVIVPGQLRAEETPYFPMSAVLYWAAYHKQQPIIISFLKENLQWLREPLEPVEQAVIPRPQEASRPTDEAVPAETDARPERQTLLTILQAQKYISSEFQSVWQYFMSHDPQSLNHTAWQKYFKKPSFQSRGADFVKIIVYLLVEHNKASLRPDAQMPQNELDMRIFPAEHSSFFGSIRYQTARASLSKAIDGSEPEKAHIDLACSSFIVVLCEKANQCAESFERGLARILFNTVNKRLKLFGLQVDQQTGHVSPKEQEPAAAPAEDTSPTIPAEAEKVDDCVDALDDETFDQQPTDHLRVESPKDACVIS